MINIKIYYFKDKKSYNISEFESYKIKEDIKEFVSPKKYDYLRTNEFVIYNPNKRARTRRALKIRRAIALIAKETKCPVKFDDKMSIAFTSSNVYVFADRVQDKEEYSYYISKYANLKNPVVISLTKSRFCSYIELDNKTIYNYYKNSFVFPEWFRKFLKMRAIRAYSSMGFNFNSRRYNDTKWTAEDKFRHDFVKSGLDIYKIYFTLARVLDSKLDACGKGYPLSGLIYLALDIDGKCDGCHLIDERGICTKCIKDSNSKLIRTLKKIDTIPGLVLLKRLFSGTKGWHLHLEYEGKRELSEEKMREIIGTINSEEQLVDWFDGKEIDGVRQFDLFRIFKVANTCDATTACLVNEKIKRLDVNDKICEPMAMNK